MYRIYEKRPCDKNFHNWFGIEYETFESADKALQDTIRRYNNDGLRNFVWEIRNGKLVERHVWN